ncbi:uncharacterized protein ACA1_221600 [Acanthamoeba castellanii str. Neff]|uniref:Uncharacterized protein n=1 Tax=Acanthamoeba castellanii (strain ATCC 30010 / Neff) TaxID=1257118 RepID=L8GS30_ACACF|nr:uncharacterized protein ACA1_221600 [Acanthamoeba castellanii str. Neff]ELR15984.1 hypothetical protein ACA1_221600 [Acanthamoeba castellanii str. Neff]
MTTPIPPSTSFTAHGLKRKAPSRPIKPNPSAARRAEADSTNKRRRITESALRASVLEYVRLDDRIRDVTAELKGDKKRREQLRVGIMDALKASGKPACKTDDKGGRMQHLRIKTRKARVKPKRAEAIARMEAWTLARGLPPATGEELYKAVYESPDAMVEKTSLCRIKPRKPRPSKTADKVLMLGGPPSDDEDEDSSSGSGSSCTDDSDDSSSSSDDTTATKKLSK